MPNIEDVTFDPDSGAVRRLEREIQNRIEEIYKAFGRRLSSTSINPYIQNAVGKLEALKGILLYLKAGE